MFPEAAAEGGKVDFNRLRLALGESVETGRERFGLTWAGKADCFTAIQSPSLGTLLPAPEQSVDWESTENVVIEGDNLEVLKLLQKSYFGKIKMIYIDPPYNTGSDFIYPDNYAESLQTYLEYTGQVDPEGKVYGTNAETDGRFHSKWLNMMFPRIYLAANLLRDDGVLAISIGENELGNLTQLCNELLGEENRVTICSRVMKTGGQKGLHFSPCVDYVLIYAKDIEILGPFRQDISQNLIDKVYTKIAESGPRKGERYRIMGLYQPYLDPRANQRYFIGCPDGQLVIPPGSTFPSVATEGQIVKPTDGDGVWRWTYETYKQESDKGNVEFVKSDKTSLVTPSGKPATWNVYTRIWLNERLEEGQVPGNILERFENRHSSAELKELDIPFEFSKPSTLVKLLMSICGVGEGDITLDFFAGSGSTGHAALELAKERGGTRPFICVQLPEPTGIESAEHKAGYKTIADICKERLRRVIKRLNDSDHGKLDRVEAGKPDRGLRVYRLAASNFQVWDSARPDGVDSLQRQLTEHVDHLVKGRSEQDLLAELLLKSGYPPTTHIQGISVSDKAAYKVSAGQLLICLDRQLTHEAVRAMADLKPDRVVCLDEGFVGNDQLKVNAAQTFKTKGIAFQTV
ncbi:MAG: site-specific DNA-methyltransferase [Thermoplasmata archaeon]|nr:site-specific DNA-methyltransferase [Thermoplasmata archaeon]